MIPTSMNPRTGLELAPQRTPFPPVFDGVDDVVQAIAGDELAFRRLVDRTKFLVTSVALGIVRSPRVSEDVAQDVYVQIWKDLHTLKDPESFLPWLRQVTRRRALMAIRSDKRRTSRLDALDDDHGDVADATANVEVRALDQEERLVLAEALDALPEASRDVITLFYREERSVRSVSMLLGVSESAVKKRLERARDALRDDVFARLGTIAARSAPTAAFTVAVMSAIAVSAPTTVAAATTAAVGATSKGVAAVVLAPFAGIAFGVGAGLAGVFFGHRRLEKKAVDGHELALLRRARTRGIHTMLFFAFGTLGASALEHFVHPYVAGAVHVAVFSTFLGFFFRRYEAAMRVAVLHHRAVELLRDPSSAIRHAKEERRRAIGIVLGLSTGTLGFLVGLSHLFAR
ncbi:MAG: sigma-70 family RNA polymerase sigma factor [Polyangiaceae bacterium]